MNEAIQKFQTYPDYKFISQRRGNTGQNVPAVFLDFVFTYNKQSVTMNPCM